MQSLSVWQLERLGLPNEMVSSLWLASWSRSKYREQWILLAFIFMKGFYLWPHWKWLSLGNGTSLRACLNYKALWGVLTFHKSRLLKNRLMSLLPTHWRSVLSDQGILTYSPIEKLKHCKTCLKIYLHLWWYKYIYNKYILLLKGGAILIFSESN